MIHSPSIATEDPNASPVAPSLASSLARWVTMRVPGFRS